MTRRLGIEIRRNFSQEFTVGGLKDAAIDVDPAFFTGWL